MRPQRKNFKKGCKWAYKKADLFLKQDEKRFDGTTEDGSFRRLVNDSTHPNCKVQCFEEEGLPSLYFVALRDILLLVRRYRTISMDEKVRKAVTLNNGKDKFALYTDVGAWGKPLDYITQLRQSAILKILDDCSVHDLNVEPDGLHPELMHGVQNYRDQVLDDCIVHDHDVDPDGQEPELRHMEVQNSMEQGSYVRHG
ncbi:hypothetical protein DPMN_084037 [Dreissena polymorpha]|uniref:SET domain-containing protein n=1 Tax=Dreissena polymorpha TaxID=45954 RepID=A0A9D4BBP0_DREPO|nr:hypothetical protein DPMN_084037 [Dreissena polymorpha]